MGTLGWTSFLIAVKKAAVTGPWIVLADAVTLPTLFGPVAEFLGPHALAGIGGMMGSAVRFHLLKLRWRNWPTEGLFAGALGVIFGQAELPVVGPMFSRISPDMLPVAQGTAIGILMAAGTGFLADFIRAYRDKGGGA